MQIKTISLKPKAYFGYVIEMNKNACGSKIDTSHTVSLFTIYNDASFRLDMELAPPT